MIKGTCRPLWPTIRGTLSLPALSESRADVDFLLDTGAAFSIVHPRDIRRLSADVYDDIAGREVVTGRGIGGQASYFEEEAVLSFEHTDGALISYILPVHIAVPTADNADYPSLLGMDFLMHFRMTMSHREGLLELR